MSNPKTEPTRRKIRTSGSLAMTHDRRPHIILEDALRGGGTQEAYNKNLNKAEASKLIAEMRQQGGVR